MNPLEQLNAYLRRVERQLRLIALCRGAAVLAGTALAATVFGVLLANHFAFAAPSVTAARWLLYLALALAAAFALAAPIVRVNRAQAAHTTERRAPELEQRLLTIAERAGEDRQPDPFLELLAADSLDRVREACPEPIAAGSRAATYGSLAAAALGGLIWLIAAGPGFLGYGAALLWAGPEGPDVTPYYAVLVSPGNATVRRHRDQLVTARLVGFQAAEVRLAVRHRGATKWEQAAMRPQAGGPGFELLLAGIPESLDYYVLAGKLRSPTYTLRVADLPVIKRIRVTYRFPAWTGLAPLVEDPGGDLRAVEGAEAEIAVETDRPLERGALALGDGSYLPLNKAAGDWRSARLKIQADGRYYIAVRDEKEWVRLSEDYLILAQNDAPPEVRIRRPGRDARVSPIEEVTVAVEASDEFGLKELTLNYSVNGGPERKISLLGRPDTQQAEGSATLYLEDFRLSPGDVVSLYAQARDARQTARTDIYFLEAQPFEREYSQSQRAAGEAGSEGGEREENRISERQKEIIAATWNQIRRHSQDAETARFLTGVQSKLRDQARSLARRIESRELTLANQEFQTFSREMAKAAEAMSAAASKLEGARWQEALGPEQQALQHLLRAEATFRQIQVAFGSRGSRGGGRGGAGRDLESLFELELDTEKNQYETGQRAASRSAEQRELDEALRKLEELARRQQELAERLTPRLSFEQRWQQEMLRREAAALQRQMERLARQAATGQGGESEQAGGADSAAQRQRLRQMGRAGVDPRVQQALERLAQATRDMGQPASRQQAAEQLRQARDILSGLQRQQAGDRLADMARRGERLALRQRDFAERLRGAYGEQSGRGTREQAERLADEKQQMLAELERLQNELAQSARELAAGQRAAASRLREALGDLQRQELAARMRYNAELIRRGWGQLAIMREAPVTAGLDQLRDQLHAAQAALERGPSGADQLPRALEALERARRRLAGERSAQQPGSQQVSGEQPGGQPAGVGGQMGGISGRRQGAGGPVPGSYAAMNFGDWQPGEAGGATAAEDPAAVARAYQEALRELSRLRGTLGEAPEEARELEALLSEFMRFDPRRAPGNPALLERMRAQFLAELGRLELQWRRRMGEAAEAARSGAAETAPPGYAEAVAEYFRRLSRQR